MTDPKQAAERLIKCLENRQYVVYRDVGTVARAYLADDDVAIDEAWVRSIAPRYWEAGKESYWPEYGLRFAEPINSDNGGFYFWNEGERSHMQVPSYIPITTRGQLRRLLEALRG